jgi:hypothetical protein
MCPPFLDLTTFRGILPFAHIQTLSSQNMHMLMLLCDLAISYHAPRQSLLHARLRAPAVSRNMHLNIGQSQVPGKSESIHGGRCRALWPPQGIGQLSPPGFPVLPAQHTQHLHTQQDVECSPSNKHSMRHS